MNNIRLSLLFVVVFMTFSQCHFSFFNKSVSESTESAHADASLVKTHFEFSKNGKCTTSEALDNLYTQVRLDDNYMPEINAELLAGLKQQLKVLKHRKSKVYLTQGEPDLSTDKLITSVQTIIDMVESGAKNYSDNLDAFQIKGEDGKGNVYFTGYFTPVLKVSKTKTAEYKYPLYARPKMSGSYPTRAEIDGNGALAGMGLELAYTKSLADIYFMQVQGSGIVEYPNGKQELFAYAGSNKHSYKSIGSYMIRKGYTTKDKVSLTYIKRYLQNNPQLAEEILFYNDSYIFFDRKPYQKTPKGAGLVPLTTDYSIAVDPKYIPLGSCLLAAVPIINKSNEVVKHEYRVLIAQDTGGVIKGPGHVDLYSGVGANGRRKASALHHYGKMWLLLSKENQTATDSKILASL